MRAWEAASYLVPAHNPALHRRFREELVVVESKIASEQLPRCHPERWGPELEQQQQYVANSK